MLNFSAVVDARRAHLVIQFLDYPTGQTYTANQSGFAHNDQTPNPNVDFQN